MARQNTIKTLLGTKAKQLTVRGKTTRCLRHYRRVERGCNYVTLIANAYNCSTVQLSPENSQNKNKLVWTGLIWREASNDPSSTVTQTTQKKVSKIYVIFISNCKLNVPSTIFTWDLTQNSLFKQRNMLKLIAKIILW